MSRRFSILVLSWSYQRVSMEGHDHHPAECSRRKLSNVSCITVSEMWEKFRNVREIVKCKMWGRKAFRMEKRRQRVPSHLTHSPAIRNLFLFPGSLFLPCCLSTWTQPHWLVFAAFYMTWSLAASQRPWHPGRTNFFLVPGLLHQEKKKVWYSSG